MAGHVRSIRWKHKATLRGSFRSLCQTSSTLLRLLEWTHGCRWMHPRPSKTSSRRLHRPSRRRRPHPHHSLHPSHWRQLLWSQMARHVRMLRDKRNRMRRRRFWRFHNATKRRSLVPAIRLCERREAQRRRRQHSRAFLRKNEGQGSRSAAASVTGRSAAALVTPNYWSTPRRNFLPTKGLARAKA